MTSDSIYDTIKERRFEMLRLSVGYCYTPPALLRKLDMTMLAVLYEITNDAFFIDCLRKQSALSSYGILEHTRIDK